MELDPFARKLENGLGIGGFRKAMWNVSWRDAATSFDMSELNEMLRGDYHAADLARSIARKLKNGLDMFGALSELNKLLRGLTEFCTVGSNYHILFFLSHSLLSRVANLREARGDYHAADRARSIASLLENGLDMFGALSELNELLRGLTEFSTVGSDRERVDWIKRNYDNLLWVSTFLFCGLSKVFRQSGPLKEVVEILQKEFLEGDLLKDSLELGTTDLKGLLMVFKDISSKYTSTSSTGADL